MLRARIPAVSLLKAQSRDRPGVVPGPAATVSPGSWLGMQGLRPHRTPNEPGPHPARPPGDLSTPETGKPSSLSTPFPVTSSPVSLVTCDDVLARLMRHGSCSYEKLVLSLPKKIDSEFQARGFQKARPEIGILCLPETRFSSNQATSAPEH